MFYVLLLAIAVLAEDSLGLRIGVQGVRRQTASLPRREFDPTAPLRNSGDISYYASIVLGQQFFSVLVDTGSSDLWVCGSVSVSQDAGAFSGVNYVDGSVNGSIQLADLSFSGYSISNQAFILLDPDNKHNPGSGLLGLGPHIGSRIYQTLQSDIGYPVIDRIFQQNISSPNYITMLLGRQQDPTSKISGTITIGEIYDGYDTVQEQPKLEVAAASMTEAEDHHFQIFMDENGLIGPDGRPISIRTHVAEATQMSQVIAVVDSGFSLTQLPRSAADAIYSRFEGAEFRHLNGVGETWIVPCSQEVNISFNFGSHNYPIHPMDATLDPGLLGIHDLTNAKGQACCVGMFQPITFDLGNDPTFDIILGMSFLRNTYALFNYGTFNAGGSNDPYVQFLSITDRAEAHLDFVNVRLDGSDSTGNQTLNDVPSPNSSRRKSLIYGLSIGLPLLALVTIGLSVYLYRRHRRKMSTDSQLGPQYRPLPSPLIFLPDMSHLPLLRSYYVANTADSMRLSLPPREEFSPASLYSPPASPGPSIIGPPHLTP